VSIFLIYTSNLEKVLKTKGFAVTAEIGPPKGCDSEKIKVKASFLKNCADAFNITDNQTGVVRLSSLCGSVILLDLGLEPIMQMTCRDRNRIALQSDVLGACAVGIRNILFVTGDHQCFGNHPEARGVFDLDSIQLIKVVKDMCDHGVFQSGDEIKFGCPNVFIGGVANPFADPFSFRVDRLEKKIFAGVDFIQTQSVFNIERFNCWMDEVRYRGLDKKVFILAGVTPLKSLKMCERMKFHVPGVDIPDFIYKRMKNTSDAKEEGFNISLDLIKEIKKINGVSGVHITALFWEDIIPNLVSKAGFFK
jgi:methylenetetrahydrofolate reductase (NADPH)